MNWRYENGRIYSLNENDELMAETTFIIKSNGVADIDHTYVDPSLRGGGLAGKMMEVVVEHLREKALKATASCSYANAWLKKHSETCSDIISEDIYDEVVACRIGGKH